MELDPQEVSRVWWQGAIGGAAKGVVQGLMLGFAGACILFALNAVFPGLGLFTSLSTFLFAGSAAHPLFAPIAMVTLNAVLGAVGGFLNSGDIAVNAYKQEVDHQANMARIEAIESREKLVEQCVAPMQSRRVQQILADGAKQPSFAEAEEARDTIPTQRTLH